MTRTAVVRTPGEDAPITEDAAQAVSATAVAAAAPAAQKETLDQRFDRMEAENKALREKVGVLTDIARANPKATEAMPSMDLPDISEFTGKNQHKQAALKSSVLTKQGWVAPAHLGSSPVLHELQKRGLSGTA